MPALAQRLQEIVISGSTRMSIRARELREAGQEVISLTVGEPDFATPPEAIEAAHQAALAGRTKYPPNDGWPELKAAVQRKFRRENGLDYALDEIIVANGGKQVILDAILATVDAGDEIVIPTPFWSAYADIGKLAGGVPVLVPCPQNNGFKLRPEDLEAAITPRTKWVTLNFPNNPSGAALTRAEVKALADVLMRHPHVWVLSDEMYEHIIYEDTGGHHSIAAVEPGLRERTLTVSGASKTYAMTGWRVGFGGGPRALIKAMTNMQSQTTNGIATVAQAATIAALDGPQDGVEERRRLYRERRDLVVSMLNECPGLQCHKPEGAFYVYPSVAGCLGKTTAGGKRLETDEDVAMALLEENHVATVSGAAYSMSPYIRLSYAADTETLREACARIQDFCRGLA
ncbi:pyridoxal phosphate-dependent aminotransferase [Muricoccus pecuniae]|uniref:Aminotransferase n=1 Tax=Muricoccus pecuniae TaxID=693023 RepID=A0A840YEP4_9PROT|nr:pyridoxal phosphate-dependent aminotransferase [Roseomonas pecuniae]MBB5692353.1 aspartate aminotransferase [Roseomonas pecuniae]